MPVVMERRLQQLRGSSYVLTLPKEWVEDSGLRKGSGVVMSVEPGLIRITPSERAGEVALLAEDESIRGLHEPLIKSCYLSGARSLRIVFREAVPAGLLTRIRGLRSELPGMIIMREGEGVVEIEFGMDVFRDLGHGLRVYLQSMARAISGLRRFIERRDAADYESASSDASECRVYAESLFRRAAQLLPRPSEEEPFYSLPQLYSLTHSCLLCAEELEELIGSAGGEVAMSQAAGALGGLAEDLAALAPIVGGADGAEVLSRSRGLEEGVRRYEGGVEAPFLCFLRSLRRLLSELGRYALLTSSVRAV